MRRSAGVTVIAILSFLGSLFMLLMGALVALVPFPTTKGQPDTPFPRGTFKFLVIGAALIYVLPAIWGIFTSIGLFRMKEWARISTIVFSVLLVLMSAFGGLASLFMPVPPSPNQAADPAVMADVRIFVAVFAAGMVSIGIWWLVFFTRAKVKQQFAPLQPLPATGAVIVPSDPVQASPTITPAPNAPRRPLSLTILAWLMLVGCLSFSITILLRYPAVLFTRILTGWPATVYYLAFALVHLYVGIGLLRLKPLARRVGIAYYGFVFLHMAVFYIAPGARLRMLDFTQRSQSIFPWIQTQPWQDQFAKQFLNTPFLIVAGCFGLLWTLVPLYFLVTRKEAFEKAAAAMAERSLAIHSPVR